MRRKLVAAVALAPLCLAGRPAAAQTTDTMTDTVTSGLNAPIATATVGDIDITSREVETANGG